MDGPSTSNVTGRRKRNAVRDSDDDESDSRATPIRKVRGNKTMKDGTAAKSALMEKVNTMVDDIINKKKCGNLNCFEFKTALELYGVEEMLRQKATIQEMATVLESAQHIISYRVDRLLQDVRQVDSALCSGDVTRGENDKEEIHISVDSRRLRKKMAVADGMSGMSDFFNQMEEEEQPNGDLEDDDDNMLAGEIRNVDLKENSKDVDRFLKRDVDFMATIEQLSIIRGNALKAELSENVSQYVSSDDTAHDVKDSNIDWLRSNSNYQKATKGSLDNKSNSFHSLNYYGMHSPNGRALILHPRVVDQNANGCYFPSDITPSLAKNIRGLVENALQKKPQILDNYLMLEVKDRPVVGRYKIMAKENKKSALPLAEASREKDLANLTFAEMSMRTTNLDVTLAGASDMSMLPGNGLPLTRGANDVTIDLGRPNSSLNQTISNPLKQIHAEYSPPSYESLRLDENLIGKIPLDPPDMDKLEQIYEQKLEHLKSSNDPESKTWKNGLRAEEWGEDTQAEMKASTRSTVLAGIEGWMKATDAWTNYDVVKMITTREAQQKIEETLNENDIRNLPPDVGKYYFLMKSEEYMNSYPVDRGYETKMIGEEKDIMLVCEEDVDDSLEQLQQQIAKQQIQDEPELDNFDEPEYDVGGGYDDMDYGGNLAAPVEYDDIGPAPMGDAPQAEILFNDRIDETVEEERNERAIERDIEKIAIGPEEVAELMTSAPPKQLVPPTAEMRDEIRNIGKNDNAHWIPPEVADAEKQAALVAQRKRKEKKLKNKKVGVDDFIHYFRDIPDDELQREMIPSKHSKIADEKNTFLTAQQLYMPTLGNEHKPYVAFEMGLLGNSGLFFKKSYGKIRLERTKVQKSNEEMFPDDHKVNADSDVLNWLLTFNGFKCMENPETVEETNDEHDQNEYQPEDNYVDAFDGIDYDPRHEQELAATQMGPDMKRKFELATSHIHRMMPTFHYNTNRGGEYADSDDEFEDSMDRQTIQAKNLDAAKHKKVIANILTTNALSMPSIQYALEQLTLNNTTLRQNNTTLRGNATVDGDETARPLTPSFDADKTLISVFDYQPPNNLNCDVNEVMRALTEVPDYQEEEEKGEEVKEPADEDQPSTSEYKTKNTKNREVVINGCHTLLSLALSMPPKMGEQVRPSSIVSFLLHIANENGLKIIQDRSKRSWMSDFVVLNKDSELPSSIVMGNIEAQSDFWRRTQDPDAIESTTAGVDSNMLALLAPKAPVRKGRGAAQSNNLGAIEEEEMTE